MNYMVGKIWTGYRHKLLANEKTQGRETHQTFKISCSGCSSIEMLMAMSSFIPTGKGITLASNLSTRAANDPVLSREVVTSTEQNLTRLAIIISVKYYSNE
jgi:hypothetical protein